MDTGAWIGGRKGRMGGNPQSVNKSSGDLPAASDSVNRSLGLSITSVLMGRGVQQASQFRTSQPSVSAPLTSPEDVKLPAWLVAGAHVCYLSRSTGQRLEVIVEMVNTAKGEVEISSTQGGIWKVVPFAAIQSPQNPLFPQEALPHQEKEAEEVVGPRLPSASKGEAVVDLTDEAEPGSTARQRSRSPKRH